MEKGKRLCSVRKLIDVIPEENERIVAGWGELAQQTFEFADIGVEIAKNVLHVRELGLGDGEERRAEGTPSGDGEHRLLPISIGVRQGHHRDVLSYRTLRW